MMQIAALVLAAGEARRFGGKKQLAKVKGDILLCHVLKQLPATDLCGIYCVLGAYRDQIKHRISGLAQVIEFADWRRGMGASLAYGIKSIPDLDALDGVMICLGDQIALREPHYQKLLQSFNGQHISTAWYAANPGVPAIFPLSYRVKLSGLDGDQGAKKILRTAKQMNTVSIAEAKLDIDYANQIAGKTLYETNH